MATVVEELKQIQGNDSAPTEKYQPDEPLQPSRSDPNVSDVIRDSPTTPADEKVPKSDNTPDVRSKLSMPKQIDDDVLQNLDESYLADDDLSAKSAEIFYGSMTLKHEKTVKLPYRLTQTIHLGTNDELWITYSNHNFVTVFDTDGNRVRGMTLESLNKVQSAIPDGHGHMIVACLNNNGLQQAEIDGKNPKSICPGTFPHATYNSEMDTLYALESNSNSIVKFTYQAGAWVPIIIKGDFDIRANDTISVSRHYIVVCSRKHDTLTWLSQEGKLIKKYKASDYIYNPKVLGVDKDGTVMVCESESNLIKTCTITGEWWSLLLPKGIGGPNQAVVDVVNRTLYVITSGFLGKDKFVKFSIKQHD